MAIKTMNAQQECDVSIGNVVDAAGQPAQFDPTQTPVWATDFAGIAIAPAFDGMSAVIISGDELGAWTVTVTADGRWGDDVLPVTGVLSGNVAPPDAVSFELTAGENRPKSPPLEPA